MPNEDSISYEDWVRFIFDRTDRNWVWKEMELENFAWLQDSSINHEYFCKLAEKPLPILSSYSHDQIGDGLWVLFFPTTELCAFEDLSEHQTVQALEAFTRLALNLIAKICPRDTPVDAKSNNLVEAFVMLWDSIPIWPNQSTASHKRIFHKWIDELQNILEIDHPVCVESALEGLRLCALIDPDRPETITFRWIIRNRDPGGTYYKIAQEMLEYRRSVRGGTKEIAKFEAHTSTGNIPSAHAVFTRQKAFAEHAFAQLDDAQFFTAIAPGLNSVAVIARHMTGNLLSRWTDFLTTDGEKDSRDRDAELAPFAADMTPRQQSVERHQIMLDWDLGWVCLFMTLASLTEADLARTVTIRTVEHSVSLAIMRQLDHYAFHVGQINTIARALVGTDNWKWFTLPPGATAEFNKKLRNRK